MNLIILTAIPAITGNVEIAKNRKTYLRVANAYNCSPHGDSHLISAYILNTFVEIERFGGKKVFD